MRNACALDQASLGASSTRELATLLECTPGNVWQIEQRALRKLDARLGEEMRAELESALRDAERRPTEAREQPNMLDVAEISHELHRRARGTGRKRR